MWDVVLMTLLGFACGYLTHFVLRKSKQECDTDDAIHALEVIASGRRPFMALEVSNWSKWYAASTLEQIRRRGKCEVEATGGPREKA